MSDTDGLVPHAPVALIEVDLQGVIRSHNPEAARWLRAGAPLLGANLVAWLTPAGRMLYETRCIPELLDRGELTEIVLGVRDGDGRSFEVLMNARLHVGADGARRLSLAWFSASKRIAFERELVETRRVAERARAHLSALQDATSRLAVAEGLDDLGAVLVDATRETTQASWVQVSLLGDRDSPDHIFGSAPDGDELTMRDDPSPSCPENVSSDTVTPVRVFRTAAELRADHPHGETLVAAGVEAAFRVPIAREVDGRRVELGVISAWFRRARALETDTLETVQAFAVQAERVLEHVRLQGRVRHQALHDTLTGLTNRWYFAERVQRLIAHAARTGETIGVLFLDLDGFKPINDECGHDVGDDVLREVAQRLRESCRADEVIARLGGDEFVIAVIGVDGEGLDELGTRVLGRIAAPLPGRATGFTVSASIGAVLVPSGAEGVDAESLVSAADAAMYAAKRAGRARIVRRAWSKSLAGAARSAATASESAGPE